MCSSPQSENHRRESSSFLMTAVYLAFHNLASGLLIKKFEMPSHPRQGPWSRACSRDACPDTDLLHDLAQVALVVAAGAAVFPRLCTCMCALIIFWIKTGKRFRCLHPSHAASSIPHLASACCWCPLKGTFVRQSR